MTTDHEPLINARPSERARTPRATEREASRQPRPTSRWRWRGIWAVIPTPLRDDETVDEEGLAHLVRYAVESAAHGIVVLGSGGEAAYFTLEERLAIARRAVEANAGRLPLLVGVSFTSTYEAVRFVRAGDALGIDGYLVALPSCYPVSADSALDHYSRVASSTRTPIVYHHDPQLTGLSLGVDAIARILALDGIVGLEDATLGARDLRSRLDAVRKPDFAAFAGTSFSITNTLGSGASGVICPIATLAPRLVLECFEAWNAGDRSRAAASSERILDLLPLMNTFALPTAMQKLMFRGMRRMPAPIRSGRASRHAVVKETLRQLGHPIRATVRRPLPSLTEADRRAIARLVAERASGRELY